MKLYVCWGTTTAGGHPCGVAHRALKEAGHDPEVIRSYGWRVLPDPIFNRTRGRQEAKRLTGDTTLPLLVTDTGEVVSDSERIVAWAERNAANA